MARKSSSFRRSARARGVARRRGAMSTSTTRTSAYRRRRGGPGYILPALVVAGLALWLWPKIVQAKPPVTPIDPKPPIDPTPKPWPAGTAEARVQVAGFGGMNTRSAPSPTATIVSRNDARNGTIIGVLSTGHAEQGPGACARCEWWEIITPGGSRGFARAVGPQGESNFVALGALPQRGQPSPVPVGTAPAGPPGEAYTGPTLAYMPLQPPASANGFAPYAVAPDFAGGPGWRGSPS